MIALGLLGIFLVFALLMFTRRMPALLALPSMAILIGVLAQVPITDLLNVVIAQGAVKLAAVYVAVFAGAMMGRVLMQTGVAEEIIKRAAEYGGERPLVVSLGLLLVTAILFTTLQGLGAIITVGSLVLPIMMSLGIPRKMAGTLFLLAFSTGFIFNPIMFTLYRQLLQLKEEHALPAELASFALVLLVLMLILILGYAFWAAKRSGEILLMKAESKPSDRIPYAAKSKVPFLAYFSPIVPLLLFFGFNYWGLKLDFIASFIIGSLFAVWTTDPRNSIKILSASAIKGVEDGAPAALLMMGIGMLLNALSLPAIKDAMLPLIQALPFQSGLFYIAFFGLLSPLALYRGPLNVFGIGMGIFSIMVGAQVLPAMALIAAVMCVVQMQNTCDPTNTHNVWIANFVGVRVETLTRETIGPIMVLCLIGLVIAAVLYL